jgi:hypothetical protein
MCQQQEGLVFPRGFASDVNKFLLPGICLPDTCPGSNLRAQGIRMALDLY